MRLVCRVPCVALACRSCGGLSCTLSESASVRLVGESCEEGGPLGGFIDLQLYVGPDRGYGNPLCGSWFLRV